MYRSLRMWPPVTQKKNKPMQCEYDKGYRRTEIQHLCPAIRYARRDQSVDIHHSSVVKEACAGVSRMKWLLR